MVKEELEEMLYKLSVIKRKLSVLEEFIQPQQEISKNYVMGWIKGLKEDLEEIDLSIVDLIEMELS